MSIRYKFILSLLALTATCLGIYILIAKNVFENDKELTIFESTSQTSNARALTLNQNLDESLSFASSLASTWDEQSNRLSATAQNLFDKKSNLLSLGIYENGQFVLFESKTSQIRSETLSKKITSQQPMVAPLDNTDAVIVTTPIKSNSRTSAPRYLVVTVSLAENINQLKFSPDHGGSFISLNQNALSNKKDFPFDFATQVIRALPQQENLLDQTGLGNILGAEYMLSSRDVQFGGLQIYSAVPKALAFQGLDKLYDRSIKFFALIFFIVLFVSVLMTQSLLKNLDKLTIATSAVSKGEFDVQIGVNSTDEFGTLADSFQTMSQEIKRLIVETQEKARMQTELKTAQTVQENLFPSPTYKNGDLEVAGLYRSASECGGDWWFHFEHPTGVYILICDATGHGAPAALITAAAKATVNLMKKEPQLTIEKLVSAFNYALYETARGNILMTGFVLHFRHDRSISYVNASHEPPFVIGDDGIEFLIDPIGPRFGESLSSTFTVGQYNGIPGKAMILYTDGITGQNNDKGRALGDKKLTKFLSQFDMKTCALADINTGAFKLVDDFRKSQIQEDDLTIVSIRFANFI